ncbi:MAG TPA: glycosyltransferase 87 family protein [Planctomycetota bacterium]|nr:glycosyltransferase 87 family protein [Planctomycetota bacterium]
MGLRATVLLSVLGTVAVLTLLLLTHEWGAGHRPDGKPRAPYLLEDTFDRTIYQRRGRWLPAHRLPYLEEDSEYPQLATWMFALPYLFFESHVPVGRAQTDTEFAAHPEDSRRYFDLHHAFQAVPVLGLLIVTALLLRDLGRSPGWALLMFLPGTLYFGFNRFDAWPAALVALALLLQLRRRPLAAAVVLGLGTMMKWYPVLLLPLFLAHDLWRDSPPDEPARARLARLPRAVLGPGLAAAGVIVAILGITFLWGGGWDAVTYVYSRQGDRVHNPPSLAAALLEPWRWGVFPLASFPAVYRVLFVLQVLPAVALACAPVRSPRALVLGCLCVVLAFAQFGKVFSPQWICWVAPLAVLVAPGSRMALALLVALQFLIYLQIPVLYFARMTDPASAGQGAGGLQGATAFWAASDTRIALLALFWAWSCWAFLRTVCRPAPLAAPTPA